MGYLVGYSIWYSIEIIFGGSVSLLTSAGSPKLCRYLLGVIRKRRRKARRNESAPSKPTDSATFSIEVSPTERRRRASFSRSVSTNMAGDEPKCSLKRRKNCRGERHARRARDSTDISFRE